MQSVQISCKSCRKCADFVQVKIPKTMKNLTLYLDTRCAGMPIVKVRIFKNKSAALISTDIRIPKEQWDSSAGMVINTPKARNTNIYLNNIMIEVEEILMRNKSAFKDLSAYEIAKRVREMMNPEKEEKPKDLFFPRAVKYMEECKRTRTREIYAATLSRIRAFAPNYEELRFSDITIDWLKDFDEFLQKTSPSRNARNIHFRNIRTIFNVAIDDEITTLYPFRKFKIHNEETIKRSLTIDQLARLFLYEPKEYAARYLDIFKLMFYLIGINTVDLAGLKDIQSGRVQYHRAKTNRLYSIKVEPEAMDIIRKYQGKEHLIDVFDGRNNYLSFGRLMNMALHDIGKEMDGKSKVKVFSGLTTYWARHTWATIAAELDIPKETIAKALGHGGREVTDVYIRFDDKKIDKANRQVIDYLNEHIEKIKAGS